MDENLLELSLQIFLPHTPAILVYITGIIMTIVMWRRYPKPCLYAFIAVCILFLQTVGSASFNVYYAYERAYGAPGLDSPFLGMFSVVRITLNLLHLTGIVLLFVAIFTQRQPISKS